MLIAPSILNADNLSLGEKIKKATDAGITRFHIDIMDGHFVPNLSFGPELVSDFKREFPMIDAEIHLMSDNPKLLVPAFVKAGADLVELHYEAMDEGKLNYWLDYLNSNSVKAVLVLNPDTPISVLEKFAPKINQVLLMTVYPGFGGQKFLQESVSRIKEARQLLDQINPKIPIEVDGGIDGETAKIAKDAGAEIFVAGSYIFRNGSISEQINKLNEIIK
ncbi:ribulose-phosphate 3-epimerase [Lactobacillus hamsteri]|uniref:Ribulose-phosphate 3-epimerase n=1 Tax=Lactobacillus hamsteri DSM 5661 = JCM 6256 TaxID=1423754 RepID=A0A0R1YK68_9LACO|nr:ribulose-phosphate 3-epimerase [Lactobacillus hamsteri]KRM41268.1 ribulose-phosphate 3-epimerase [Lactobacillus hamsteri DSM 5661 = JCM 6256]